MRRLTTDDVHILRCEPQVAGGVIVEATVKGQRQTFVVDHNPAWSQGWLCSCGRAPDCAHIRVTREAIA